MTGPEFHRPFGASFRAPVEPGFRAVECPLHPLQIPLSDSEIEALSRTLTLSGK